MVPGKRYIHSRRAYSGSLQLGSRCRVKDGYGPKWLEIDALNLCQATDDMGALEVDLFAAHHNKLNSHHASSVSGHPEAEAVDALAQTWSDLRPYPFPPFILIGRCLRKLTQDWVREMVMIVPFWQNKTWYPNLLSQLIDLPLLLPDKIEIIMNPRGEFHPLVEQSCLSLIACRVSAVTRRTEEFQRSLWSYQQPGDMGQRKAYSSAWGKWILWCNKQESNPFPSTIGPLVNFLTEEFKLGKQYTTMNFYRSALSTTTSPTETPFLEAAEVDADQVECAFEQISMHSCICKTFFHRLTGNQLDSSLV